MICLVFLFFETAFGICLGCKAYSAFYGKKAQYCPGEVCDPKARQPIQKITLAQVGIVLLFLVIMTGGTLALKSELMASPTLMWGMERPQ
jgi:hypothetical protein